MKRARFLSRLRAVKAAFLRAGRGSRLHASRAAFRLLQREGFQGFRRRLAEVWHPEPTCTGAVDPLLFAVVTTPHARQTAELIARTVNDIGYNSTVYEDTRRVGQAAHCIVLCPQMFDNLPLGYIACQLEQTVASRWFTPAYLAQLKRARLVLDYAQTNIDNLARKGVSREKMQHLPLAPMTGLAPSVHAARSGILFYGDDRSPRRKALLAALRAEFPEMTIAPALFADDLAAALSRTAVVVNLHFGVPSLLETARICQALSHGAPVVSEMALDQAEHPELGEVVDFVPEGEVAALIAALRPYVGGAPQALARRRQIAEFVPRAEAAFSAKLTRILRREVS